MLTLCTTLMLAGRAWGGPAAPAPAAPAAPSSNVARSQSAGTTEASPPTPVRADGADVYLDEAPPSAYDRLGSEGSPALAPESLGLLVQLGRTLLALGATVALVVLFCKLLLPKLMQRVGPHRTQALAVTERLVLDGKNSLVAVEHTDGRRWLLGCGEHGVTVVDAAAAPSGAPSSGPSAPSGTSFAITLDGGRPPPAHLAP